MELFSFQIPPRSLKILFTITEVTAQGALSDGSRSNSRSRLGTTLLSAALLWKNQRLVADEPVEFEK